MYGGMYDGFTLIKEPTSRRPRRPGVDHRPAVIKAAQQQQQEKPK